MSGKIIRSMLAALLALVLAVNVSPSFATYASHSTNTVAMERDTTAS